MLPVMNVKINRIINGRKCRGIVQTPVFPFGQRDETETILPKRDQYLKEIQEIKSQLEQINLKCERLSSEIRREHDESNSLLEGEQSEKRFESNSGMGQIEDYKCSTSEIRDFEEPDKDVFTHFHSMLQNGYFSDLSIVCGSDVLRAHKVVLSARSPVFEAMFTSPMQESQTDVVAIDDIDVSTISIMLSFMYSGNVKDLSVSSASSLLYAAQKYQIEGLKKKCVHYLISKLSNQNALEMLQIADLYDQIFKAKVMSFINKNFSFLKCTEEWIEMKSNQPCLAMEIYSYVVDRYEEKSKD